MREQGERIAELEAEMALLRVRNAPRHREAHYREVCRAYYHRLTQLLETYAEEQMDLEIAVSSVLDDWLLEL